MTFPAEGSAATKVAAPNPLMNHLLAALPSDIYQAVVVRHLEFVPLELGQELSGPGQTLNCVYFPTTAVVSMLCTMENGASAEMAIVGNDGILGISLCSWAAAASPIGPWCKLQAPPFVCEALR